MSALRGTGINTGSPIAASSPRVGLVLKADLRAGHDTGQMTRKVERIEQRLAGGADAQ